jgi:hypothetical protein
VSGGVDVITATVPGFTAPIFAQTVAVQGPPKIVASAMSLTNDALVLVTVQNPMGFHESCEFSLPTAVEIGEVSTYAEGGSLDASTDGPILSEDAGSVVWNQSCPWSPDGGGTLAVDGGASTDTETCVVESSSTWTTVTKIFALSFIPGLTDAVATGAGLTQGRTVTGICEDQFHQQTTFSISAQWGPAQAAEAGKNSGDAASANDAGASD